MLNVSRITIAISEDININNYTCSQGYLLLPAINEYTWNHHARVVLYFVGLIWCFLGVAFIADVFMASIERITSQTRTVKIADPEVPGGFIELELKVWNDTVANLSLLALGTSAPEILLSVIEIMGNNFESGELGPGTIVGSAAFNLLFISAICISCVPDGEIRRIHSFKVFGVTSFTCVFAYVWMVIVLMGISPNVIDIWEAVLTFLFFPLLLIVAYAAEKDFFMKKTVVDEKHVVGIPVAISNGDVVIADETGANDVATNGEVVTTDEIHANDAITNGEIISADAADANGDPDTKQADPDIASALKSSPTDPESATGKTVTAPRVVGFDHSPRSSIARRSNIPLSLEEEEEMRKLAKALALDPNLTPDMIADILTRRFKENTPHTRTWYRSNAIRGLTGAKKHISQINLDLEDMKRLSAYDLEEQPPSLRASRCEVDPSGGGKFAVVEFTSAAVAVLESQGTVRLGVKRTGRLNIPVSVRAQTINGTASAGEDFKPYDGVIEFKENEALKQVIVEIIDDNVWEPDEFFFVKLKVVSSVDTCVLGGISICEVTIINDDEPGVLEFLKPSFMTKETEETLMIPVVRKNGADGQVSVSWVAHDITAVEGRDYVGKEGVISFEDQETKKNIIIRCLPNNNSERDDSFRIELKDPSNGAVIGKLNKTIVTIVSDEEFNGLVSRIVNMSKANQEALELTTTTYPQQFEEAMNVNGGDLENATFMSYILHFCSFFWKVLFAFIPPTHYCGGWATFIISLSMIGLLTAIIGDLASIFGCLIGLEDSITAITLVAMGTSMPDTFASKTAAIMEKTADSSIGNVNGSNSVNVFLGLGLPWLMASIYHYMKGSVFRVRAGDLGFSVMIYSIVAVIAIIILICRRTSSYVGAELGGPKCIKILCSIIFVMLWVAYISLSALQVKGIIVLELGTL